MLFFHHMYRMVAPLPAPLPSIDQALDDVKTELAACVKCMKGHIYDPKNLVQLKYV